MAEASWLHARTFLFVPGDRPERFHKAASARGVEAVILDLEDSVSPERKSYAREMMLKAGQISARMLVRLNAADGPFFEDDLAATIASGVAGIVVPKADAEAMQRIAAATRCPLLALVESGRGMSELPAIAARAARLAIGTIDLALDLGLDVRDEIQDPFRLQMSVASRVAGLPAPIDGVTTRFDDDGEQAAIAASRVRALGFGGKLCIHPRQAPEVLKSFLPGEAETVWARRVLAIGDGAGSMSIDGEMVDAPVIERARRILGGINQ